MKIIITDLDHDSHQIETDVLGAAGFDFTLLNCKTEDDLIAQAQGAQIAINQYAPFTARVFAALPDLRQIVRYGVGVNNVDLAAASAAGVQVCNVPDYGMNEVSDHALAMTLAVVRKIVPMSAATKAGAWDYALSKPIRRQSEMVVGVIGLGRIGRLYARKMHALGFKVLGQDLFYQPSAADGTDYITPASVEAIITGADIIATFCPLTPETRHLLNAEAFAKMKPGVAIINTSRGGIIDETALAAALVAGQVSGAGIDTTEIEPLPMDSPLRGIDTCLLTPHMAWYSEDAARELKRKVAEEALRFARGQAVNWPVNTPA